MKPRLIFILIPLLMSMAGAARAAHAAERSQFDKSGQASVNAMLPNANAVTLTVLTAPPCGSIPFNREIFWGSGSEPPRHVVVAVTLAVGGERVHVPFSAYGDLSDPRSVGIDVRGHDAFDVVIQGGDASTSYQAVTRFKIVPVLRRFLPKKRRVSLNEFPAEVWQQTDYSWNTLNN